MLITPVVQQARNTVWDFMQANRLKNLPFHNYSHTSRVVEAVMEIAALETVGSQELEVMLLAAWFHDTGYSSRYDGHEAVSKEVALTFLKKQHYPAAGIQLILDCIQATKVPQKPNNLLEKILCDADLAHLAKPGYVFIQKQLRQEWCIYLDLKFTDQEWLATNMAFMQAHHYFTEYARTTWQAGKNRNLFLLETNYGF
jgi:uncharacterized protein